MSDSVNIIVGNDSYSIPKLLLNGIPFFDKAVSSFVIDKKYQAGFLNVLSAIEDTINEMNSAESLNDILALVPTSQDNIVATAINNDLDQYFGLDMSYEKIKNLFTSGQLSVDKAEEFIRDNVGRLDPKIIQHIVQMDVTIDQPFAYYVSNAVKSYLGDEYDEDSDFSEVVNALYDKDSLSAYNISNARDAYEPFIDNQFDELKEVGKGIKLNLYFKDFMKILSSEDKVMLVNTLEQLKNKHAPYILSLLDGLTHFLM